MQKIRFISRNNPDNVESSFLYEVQFEPSVDGFKSMSTTEGLVGLVHHVVSLARGKKLGSGQVNVELRGYFTGNDSKFVLRVLEDYNIGNDPGVFNGPKSNGDMVVGDYLKV